MSRVLKSDLIKANTYSGMYVEYIIDSLNNLKSNLDNFINLSKSDSKLSSSSYDMLRSRLELYSELLSKICKITHILQNNINSKNNSMLAFMESYDAIDDELAPQINSKISLINEYNENNSLYKNEINLVYTELNRFVTKINNLNNVDRELYKNMDPIRDDIETLKNIVNSLN